MIASRSVDKASFITHRRMYRGLKISRKTKKIKFREVNVGKYIKTIKTNTTVKPISTTSEQNISFVIMHLNLYNAAILFNIRVIIFVIPRISLLFPYHAQITIITKIVSATAVRGRLTGDFCN